MEIETLKELFDTAAPEFKEALNRRDFKYWYDYIYYNACDPQDIADISVSCEFTELLLKHNISPLEHMKEIPDYFLYNSEISGTFVIPNNVTNIEMYAFYNCANLTNITIPNSVTSIATWVFWNCTGLKSITIPSSVKHIGDYAFYYCKCDIIYDGTREQWKSIIGSLTLDGFEGKVKFLK